MRKADVVEMWARHAAEREEAEGALSFVKAVGVYTVAVQMVDGEPPVAYIQPDCSVNVASSALLETLIETRAALASWWSGDGPWPDDGQRGRGGR